MVAAAKLTLLLLSCLGLLWPVGAQYIDYCPKGWSYYKLNCMKYFPQLQTWDEAERQCQASHPAAHLAWVEDSREAATLRRIISYHQRVQPVWLGLHYSLQGGDWQWTAGDKYSVSNGLPGNGARGGTCGLLTHHTAFTIWSSADCSQKHHYICKFTPLH
ncbi:regenerating islet-derived protein 4 [Phaethornis superciliosus]